MLPIGSGAALLFSRSKFASGCRSSDGWLASRRRARELWGESGRMVCASNRSYPEFLGDCFGCGLVFGLGGDWNANVARFGEELGYSGQEMSSLIGIAVMVLAVTRARFSYS